MLHIPTLVTGQPGPAPWQQNRSPLGRLLGAVLGPDQSQESGGL